jgi:hypothetical protein
MARRLRYDGILDGGLMKTALFLLLASPAWAFCPNYAPNCDTQPNISPPGFRGNEQYNVRPNFGGPPPGTILNPYHFRLPNGQRGRIYSNGPIWPGSPGNPYQIRPE